MESVKDDEVEEEEEEEEEARRVKKNKTLHLAVTIGSPRRAFSSRLERKNIVFSTDTESKCLLRYLELNLSLYMKSAHEYYM